MIIWNQSSLVAQWAIERMGAKRVLPETHAIGLEIRGQLVAAVVYEKFTGHDIEMGVAADKKATKGFLKAVFRYPFIQLGCRRVTAYVASKNAASRELVERLGFVFEGLRRDAIEGDDFIQYGMLKRECQWL